MKGRKANLCGNVGRTFQIEMSQKNVLDKMSEKNPKNGKLFRLTGDGLMKYNTYG